MSDIDLTAAIAAGMRELHNLRCCDGEGPLACAPSEMTDDENNAAIALTAALPHIEKQVREQIAAELRAEGQRARDAYQAANSDHFAHDYCRWVGHAEALTSAAARIARTPKDADHA